MIVLPSIKYCIDLLTTGKTSPWEHVHCFCLYLYAQVCMPTWARSPTMAHPQVVLVGRVLTYLVRIHRSPGDSTRLGWQ